MVKTKKGVLVVNRYSSHLHCEENVAFEVASLYDGDEQFVKFTHEFSDKLGWSECVETTENDKIFYDQRQGRKGLTRFVLDRKPEKTNLLTVIMAKKFDRDLQQEVHVLITAFWGSPAEPEPWDENAFDRDCRGYVVAKEASSFFWKNHAIVHIKTQYHVQTPTKTTVSSCKSRS